MNNYFKRRMELLNELKLKKLGEHEWGTDPLEEAKVKELLALEYPQEHADWEQLLKEGEYRWHLTKDNLSEDIYVQPFDTNEVEILGDAVTLGYQITKEEFEKLLRKS